MKRLSFILVILLVLSILMVPSFAVPNSASQTVTYKIYGLDYSPYIGVNQSPEISGTISDTQLKETMKTVAPYTKWVRVYSCTGDLVNVGLIAHQVGLKIAVGVWLGKDLKQNDVEIDSLIKMAQAGQADVLILGNEAVTRGDITAGMMYKYLSQVKKAVPKIPVTAAETAATLLLYPSLINQMDEVYVNIYPYWDGVKVADAVNALNIQYNQLKKIAQNKKITVSETGWPSSGKTIANAVPSEKNAAFYLMNFVSWAKSVNVQYFYFGAFDESWRGGLAYPQEASWGIWKKDSKMKTGMMDVFKGKTVKDNWSKPVKLTPSTTSNLKPDQIYAVDKKTWNDLEVINIGKTDFLAYGDADKVDCSRNTTFAMVLTRNDKTWGSVTKNVGSGAGVKPLDLSGYNYVIIRVKGEKGQEQLKFGLGESPTEYSLTDLSTEWQDISIKISDSKRDLTDVKQIGFEIGSQWTTNTVGSKIYIDGIKFIKSDY